MSRFERYDNLIELSGLTEENFLEKYAGLAYTFCCNHVEHVRGYIEHRKTFDNEFSLKKPETLEEKRSCLHCATEYGFVPADLGMMMRKKVK